MMNACNEVILTGVVKKIYPPIVTVNKVKVERFVLEHQSVQEENGALRKVYCKMFCMILGNELSDILDLTVKVYGFIGANSQGQLVLHVNKIEKLN